MTEAELIARQSLRLAELLDEVAALKDEMRKARMYLVGIGGPLNDNVLGFDAKQRALLHKVANHLEV